jgi:hypothetical protein
MGQNIVSDVTETRYKDVDWNVVAYNRGHFLYHVNKKYTFRLHAISRMNSVTE